MMQNVASPQIAKMRVGGKDSHGVLSPVVLAAFTHAKCKLE